MGNNYFWRTYDQQEIDLIEESDAKISAFEMKWKQGKSKIPAAFSKAYAESTYEIITSLNYLPFIGG